MKKAFLTLIPALGFVAMTMTSCKDNCCTFATAEICEEDLATGYDNWDDYATYLESIGYTCN
ncbi:MAG: hypothetical protein K9J06_09545 [Flavobacteriales bacterium]|nr:hypothetical protein [Flavobacteriales bacterium]